MSLRYAPRAPVEIALDPGAVFGRYRLSQKPVEAAPAVRKSLFLMSARVGVLSAMASGLSAARWLRTVVIEPRSEQRRHLQDTASDRDLPDPPRCNWPSVGRRYRGGHQWTDWTDPPL